jgi:glycosyltransferase involved in cell wall biosynthesis
MKFLLVSALTSASGSSIRFWNIARELHERGHAVVLSERRSRTAPALHICEGVRYVPCRSTGVLPLDIAISLLSNLVLLLRHADCDVYYALKPGPNNGIPALIARLLGKRLVLDVDDLDYAYLRNGITRKAFRFIFDMLPRHFDLVTFHTPTLHDYLATTAQVPEERLHYLAQGVSPVFLKTAAAAQRKTTLVYVATLGITSDFEDLIPGLVKLFNEHRDITMNIAGDGRRRPEFEQMVRQAGLAGRIRFTGTIDHAALPAFISGHRIGVNYMRQSTVNRCRAILKIREYLACGLAVVCNDVGDVDLFREHIHVMPDPDSMCGAIKEILAAPDVVNSAGRSFIEANYRWDAIVAEFERRLASA